MIVSMFHVQVPPEMARRFEQSWKQRAGQVDKMPGFRGLEVLKSGDEPGKYIVLTRWENKADFEGWAHSPEFGAGHARSGQSGAQGGAVAFYEVIESSPA